ncbi:hypothetical protein CKO44_22745 [Rubrivivax gelatinosus]|nr:hypothetical protein [Rubrivivax gelatinosus]
MMVRADPAVDFYTRVDSETALALGRAIFAAGKRDLSHDLKLPRPLVWWPARRRGAARAAVGNKTVALSYQHAWVDAADGVMLWRCGRPRRIRCRASMHDLRPLGADSTTTRH